MRQEAETLKSELQAIRGGGGGPLKEAQLLLLSNQLDFRHLFLRRLQKTPSFVASFLASCLTVVGVRVCSSYLPLISFSRPTGLLWPAWTLPGTSPTPDCFVRFIDRVLFIIFGSLQAWVCPPGPSHFGVGGKHERSESPITGFKCRTVIGVVAGVR